MAGTDRWPALETAGDDTANGTSCAIMRKRAFWPTLQTHLRDHGHEPNRGPYRHFLPMPFHRPYFAPEFFFDRTIINVIHGAMGYSHVRTVPLGHVSVQPTEHYLGCKQRLRDAVNDSIGIEPAGIQS